MTRENFSSTAAYQETADTHVVRSGPWTTADALVSAVIRSLQGQQFECADTVFVTDADGRLAGIVRINRLFANNERRIGEIMEPEHEADPGTIKSRLQRCMPPCLTDFGNDSRG